MLKVKFDSAQPIYLQIVQGIRRALASGELQPGAKLPSQRELALTLGINPNTVQRAYREMEQMGLSETLRGQGTFIRQDETLVTSIREIMIRASAEGFITEMKALGCTKAQIVATITKLLAQMDEENQV